MGTPRRIQAVTFDVGGTLIEPWPSVGHVYAEVAAKHGHSGLSPEDLSQRFRAAFRAHGTAVNTKAEWARIVDEAFAGLLDKPPSETFFPELYERFARADAWRGFEDVGPTLDVRKQRRMKVGVIANWDDRLRPLLGALKLAEHFEAIIVSCEVGVSKPSPRIFQTAAAQLGFPADAILHVGDSFEMDVGGAESAGLRAVRVDRGSTERSGKQIRSLLDLLKLL